MASSYTVLGTEKMTTGENAGTWGTTTNTNLEILEQAFGGYLSKSIAGGVQTTTLAITDGDSTASTSEARHHVIKLTGTITGNQTVTVPADVVKSYIVSNATSGAYTVLFKAASASGFTFAATNKGTQILFADGTNIVDTGIGSVATYDLDGGELTLDADSDTSITASTDDQIDFEIAGADDFTMTANAFNVLTGSHATFADSANAKFGTGNDMLVYHDGSNSYITNAQGALKVATETSGIAVTIGHTTSETTIADNLTVTGTLTLGSGAELTEAELEFLDGITAGTAAASKAMVADGNIDITGGRNITISGELDAATLDISGNADIDGTTNLDAVDIDGAVQLDATFTVGADDQGYDVKLFGDTASAFMLWDTSTDDLVLGGAAKLYLYDAAGGEHISSDGSTLSIAGGGEIDLTATAIDINGTCDVSGTLTNASTAVNVAGKQTIWIPANAMTPTASNGCADIAAVETTSGRPDMYILDFDKDSDEFAQFAVAFPKSWNLGTVTFQVFWSGVAATGGVSWGLQGVAFADNDSIDTAYGTAVVVDDTEQGAVEEVNVSAASGAVTIAGSPGDDELCYFRIFRDVSDSNDDSGGDARLHGIKLFYTTDAKNDA